jgi:hypothetical protein
VVRVRHERRHATRPSTSLVPWWNRSRAPWRSAFAATSSSRRTSTTRVAENAPADAIVSLRRRSPGVDPAQVDGDALARHGTGHALAVHLQPAHFHGPVAGRHQYRTLGVQAAADERPRHDGTEASHREHAIDWKPRGPLLRPAGRGAADGDQRRV